MDFKTAIKAIMAAKRREIGSLSPDEVLSFRAGQLGPEGTEELLERAASSPETARALIDAGRFPEVEPVDEQFRVTEEDLDQHWQRFEQRLRQSAEPRTSEAVSPRPAEQRLRPNREGRRWFWSLIGSLRFAQAVAALLLVGLGLSWLFVIRGSIPSGTEPRLNLPIVELVPASESGERTVGQSVKLPASADGIFLVLTLRDRRSYPTYEARIDDSVGAEVWSSITLERAPEGFFTLELPRGFLPKGRYRIALHGVDGDQRDRLAIYDLVLEQS